MTNIKAMHAEADRLASQPRFELSSLYCAASLRHPADLAHCAGAAVKAADLPADVCRQDLRLQIERGAVQPLLFMPGQPD